MDLSAVRRVEAITRNLEPPPPPTFTTMTDVDIFCGTYNVNGKREKALALSWWLMQGWTTSAPHLFVITLQEMIDLSAANVVKETIADTRSKQAAEDWAAELRRHENPGKHSTAAVRARVGADALAVANATLAWEYAVYGAAVGIHDARCRAHLGADVCAGRAPAFPFLAA